MSANPYENEPGYENARSSEDKKNIANYVAKVGLREAQA
jgi:ubiquitin-conjugating enzyme E2 Z